ncbi:hypothetical protein SDC9_56158 [bioreactor metagenome]|uniref:Copper amine oxidase-like N-terminal domain-containing protein n=1 Tax=bioreactor metagenome TaxID=1076179 RepID=A0A644X0Z9_9ZZZZ
MNSKPIIFLAGVLTTLNVSSLAITALAVSGTVSFSTTNIKVNGEMVASTGDTYTLDNGAEAPYSISYTDEKGGGTVYVPIRKFSELVGVDVGWDSASSSVTVGESDASPIVTPDTTSATDYSDWTAEEEAAYQEFKGMWSKSDISQTPYIIINYTANNEDEFEQFVTNNEKQSGYKFFARITKEAGEQNTTQTKTQFRFGVSSNSRMIVTEYFNDKRIMLISDEIWEKKTALEMQAVELLSN